MTDIGDVDPLVLEAAKRAVLTDEFVRFRERAVQYAQVLTASNEYEALRRATTDEAYLEKLALERVQKDPNLAAKDPPRQALLREEVAALRTRAKNSVWILLRGLYNHDLLYGGAGSGLRTAVREAIGALDYEHVLRQFDTNAIAVYEHWKSVFEPPADAGPPK